jgi:hypothetical protein
LEAAGLAHGDWQHDNLLIDADGSQVTLVDYDGMFVPEFGNQQAPELGHPNYQHPKRTTVQFAPGLDRFSCAVLQTALLALAAEPSLWNKYGADEAILFRRDDFLNPANSRLFVEVTAAAELHHDDALATAVHRLTEMCYSDPAGWLLPLPPIVAKPEDALSFAPVVPEGMEIVPPTESVVSSSGAWTKGSSWIHELDLRVTPVASPAPPRWQAASPATVQQPVDDWWKSVAPATERLAQMRAQGQEPFSFTANTSTGSELLDRLNDHVFVAKEREHLLYWRFGPFAFAALLVVSLYCIYQFIRTGSWFPFFLFLFWHPKFMSMGYETWPRKQVMDEINQQLQKIRYPVEQRRVRLEHLQYLLEDTPNVKNITVGDFKANFLQNVPLHRALTVGVPLKAVEILQAEGITNALELQNRKAISGIPPNQMEALRRWISDLEMEAENEYRMQRIRGAIDPSPIQTQMDYSREIERLQLEMSDMEGELMRLEEQKAQCPPVTFLGYLRLLLTGRG